MSGPDLNAVRQAALRLQRGESAASGGIPIAPQVGVSGATATPGRPPHSRQANDLPGNHGQPGSAGRAIVAFGVLVSLLIGVGMLVTRTPPSESPQVIPPTFTKDTGSGVSTNRPPPLQPRCAQEVVFDQAVRGGVTGLRGYIQECQSLGGVFVQHAKNALETNVYNDSSVCIRSSCSFEGCLARYIADFPFGNRIASLRAEAQQAANSPRCKPASQTFTFVACNRTSVPIQVAVMARQSPQSSLWVVQGWALGLVGSCGAVGTFPKGEFFAVAAGPNGTRWANQDVRLCVPQQRFQRVNSPGYQCQPGEGLVYFQRFNITDDNYTWTLSGGPPAIQPRPIGTPRAIGKPADVGRPVDIGRPAQIAR
jgi:hypothetical protein